MLLIGGEWKEAGAGGTFERTDPFTGEPAGSAAAAKREDARAAADAAGEAFPEWAASPPAQRRELLQKAAGLLMERAQDIAGIVTAETGGTFGWGMFNCSLAADMLGEAAAQTTAVRGEVIPSNVPGLTAFGIRQPAGVVLGIAPWNAPVILGTRARRVAARLRQHRGVQGLRDLPAAPTPRSPGRSTTRACRRASSTSSATSRTTPRTWSTS